MRFRAASVVVACALVAGCGGSSKSKTSASTTASGATTASGVTTATTSTGAPSFASAQNCQQLAGVGAKYAQAISPTTSGGNLDLQAAASTYQALANAAPAEIRPDLQTTAQAFSSFAAALSKVGYKPGQVPTAAQLAALQSAVQVSSQPNFRAAEQRISAWARQNCG